MTKAAAPSGEIDVLLFDLGRVVIDIDFERVWARWAQEAGCAVEKIRRRIGADEPYLRYECGTISLEEYFHHLRRRAGRDALGRTAAGGLE